MILLFMNLSFHFEDDSADYKFKKLWTKFIGKFQCYDQDGANPAKDEVFCRNRFKLIPRCLHFFLLYINNYFPLLVFILLYTTNILLKDNYNYTSYSNL
jgi:hypothetical protein